MEILSVDEAVYMVDDFVSYNYFIVFIISRKKPTNSVPILVGFHLVTFILLSFQLLVCNFFGICYFSAKR
jgi:hypothetical protein